MDVPEPRSWPAFDIFVAESVANVYREAFFSGTTIRGRWHAWRGAVIVMAIAPARAGEVCVTLQPTGAPEETS